MFFSKVVLFAIFLGAISVLATPHLPSLRYALHRRDFAARVASASSGLSDFAVKRQDYSDSDSDSDCDDDPSSSPSSTDPADTGGIDSDSDCNDDPSSSPSSTDPADTGGIDQNSPEATPTLIPTSPPQPPPTTTSCTDPDDTIVSTPHTTPARSPASPPQPPPTTTPSCTDPDDPDDAALPNTPPAPSPTSPQQPPPPPTSTSSTDSADTGDVLNALSIPYASNPASGQATWFIPALGACGWVNNKKDFMVALQIDFFNSFPGYNYKGPGKSNPNTNPACGKNISLSSRGKTVRAWIADSCPTCKNVKDLDLSPAVYQALGANFDAGVVPITWHFV